MRAKKNRKNAAKALRTFDGLFQSIYSSLASVANSTSDNVHVYLKFFAVTDFNQC